MSVINAKDALELFNHNAQKYRAEEEKERLRKIEEEKEHQNQIDAKWMRDAVKHGDRIIDCIVNDGPKCTYRPFGLGKKNKHNGYYCHFDSGAIQMQDYEFIDLISDNAAKYIETYYRDKGYGCEVVKPIKEEYDLRHLIKEKGTLYLWIPTDEDEELEKKKEVSYKNGICW